MLLSHDNTLYLCTDDLVRCGLYADKSEAKEYFSNLNKLCIPLAAHPQDGRIKLVKYTDIPGTTRSKLPTYEKILSLYRFEVLMNSLLPQKEDEKAFYDTLDGMAISAIDIDKRAKELSFSKALLDWVIATAEDKTKPYLSLGVANLTELYTYIVGFLKHKQWEGLSGINSLDSFKCKLSKYRKEGMACLINGRFGLQNRLKMTKEIEVLLGEYYAGTKWSCTKIHKELCKKLSEKGIEVIDIATVKRHIAKPEFQRLYLADRDGKKTWNSDFAPVTLRRPPSRAGKVWLIDGTPMELYYKYETYDKKGNSTWHFGRLYVVVVIDAFAWKCVGYAIGKSETRDLATMAIKNAIRNEGYRPDMFYLDHGSSFQGEMLAWLKDMSHGTYQAAVGNARAKVIEPFFGHLWEQKAKEWSNFAGMNIRTKKRSSIVNEDYIKKNWRNFPSEETVVSQIQLLFSEWNADVDSAGPPSTRIVNNLRLSPTDAQENSIQKYRKDMQNVAQEEMVRIFWLWRLQRDTSRQAYDYTGIGIGIKWNNKQEVFYQVPECEHTVNKYKQVIGNSYFVKYDPDDLTKIAIFDGDRFIMTLDQAKAVGMATIDYQDDDGARIQAKIKAQKELVAQTQQERNKAKELAKEQWNVQAGEILRNPHTDEKIAAETRLKAGFSYPSHLHKDDINDAETVFKDYAYTNIPVVQDKSAAKTPTKNKSLDPFADLYA